jgi:hypothetical protein
LRDHRLRHFVAKGVVYPFRFPTFAGGRFHPNGAAQYPDASDGPLESC